MNTSDFDAAVERAAAAVHNAVVGRGTWEDAAPWWQDLCRESARVALQASGWEEAAGMIRELASLNESQVCSWSLVEDARAWVAQYTPEGK